MNGPSPLNSGKPYRIGAQSMSLPESEVDYQSTVQPARSPSAKPSDTAPQSKKQYESILNFVRNPQNQPAIPTSNVQNQGVKSMDATAPSTGQTVDPTTGQPIAPGYQTAAATSYQDPSVYYYTGAPGAPTYPQQGPIGYPSGESPYGGYPASTPGFTDPYAGMGYIDPTTGQQVAAPSCQPTNCPPTTPPTTTEPSATTATSGNTDPAKIGDGNDTITIPDKVDGTADEATQKQQLAAQNLLKNSDDVLDLGTGTDTLTIDGSDHQGTIKTTDFGGADTVFVKGKNNNLTIETDKTPVGGKTSDIVGLDGVKEDWEAQKGPDGSAVYINKETHNRITIKGDAKVVYSDNSAAENPNAKTSDGDKISADLKDMVDNSSSEDIAKQVNMNNLSNDSEKDYVALQFVLRMDNEFSGADKTGSWFFNAGKDDLTDDDFSSDDWKDCVNAARAINPALADRVQAIWDKKDDITRLDGHTGDDLSRGELEKILESYTKGETLESQAAKGANASAD
jgi:hypothetical protein